MLQDLRVAYTSHPSPRFRFIPLVIDLILTKVKFHMRFKVRARVSLGLLTNQMTHHRSTFSIGRCSNLRAAIRWTRSCCTAARWSSVRPARCRWRR